MEILVADKLSPRALDRLREMGHTVRVEVGLTPDQLQERTLDAEVLIVRSSKVPAAVLDRSRALSLVIRAGAGVNTIDVAAASARGIYVANCPGKNTDAVAELTIGLMIAADRRIVDACSDLRDGRWRKSEYGKARGLKGRALGILGLGSIGKRVAEIAQSLGMQVFAWSRSLTAEQARLLDIGYCATPGDVAAVADVLSVHVAATGDTKGLVNSDLLGLLKPDAILVNTSRGDTVDTEAMERAITERGLRVATDVFVNEPSGGDAAFESVELARQITATPHIGASTDQASEAIADEVLRIVQLFEATGKPPGAVNLLEHSSATHYLVARHLNQVGVLAGILDEIRAEGINVQEMENVIFQGGKAACCTLKLDRAPSESLRGKLAQQEAIISLQMSAVK